MAPAPAIPDGPDAAPTVSWDRFEAVLFDLDGVLTPTADIHLRAWTTMFDEFLVPRGLAPFSAADYHGYVDGKPRFDGVRSFLGSRDITLPDGEPDDAPGQGTVAALGNRKNEVFQQVLRDDGIAPYPGSLLLLDDLARRHTKVAVVSSSRNAKEVLEASGLAPRFEVVADGVVAADQHIAGKPSPDLFLAAARWLDVAPADAVVVEDALSGVAAGRAGAFGLVIGVDRGVGPETLAEAGAHLVVADLAELVPTGGDA
ncbi:MAG: beta-phosphoglucomutase family hydrolase [Ilumatobacteraceae bacterium]